MSLEFIKLPIAFTFLMCDIIAEIIAILLGTLSYPNIDDDFCVIFHKKKRISFVPSTIWDYLTRKFNSKYTTLNDAKYAKNTIKQIKSLANKHVIIMCPGFTTDGEKEFTQLMQTMQKNGEKVGFDDFVYLFVDPPGQGSSGGLIYDGTVYPWVYQLQYILYFAKHALQAKKTYFYGHSLYGLVILIYIIVAQGYLSDSAIVKTTSHIVQYAFLNGYRTTGLQKPPPIILPDKFIISNPLVKDQLTTGLFGKMRSYAFDPFLLADIPSKFSPLQIYTRTLITGYNVLGNNHPYAMVKKLDTVPRFAEIDALASIRILSHLISISQIGYLFMTKTTIPTLFIYSAEDRIVLNIKSNINVAKKYYTVMQVQNGHDNYREDPEKISKILIAFITGKTHKLNKYNVDTSIRIK